MRGQRNQRGVTYVAVPRTTYWFGHRAYHDTGAGDAPESTERPYVVEPSALGEQPIYGLAIADESEVRGVRVAVFDQRDSPGGRGQGYPGPWLELVEGDVLRLDTADDPLLFLDRLDWTDGRLVLALARCPEALENLPRTVRERATVLVNAESFASGVEVRVHAPRRGPSAQQLMSVTAFNSHALTDLGCTLRALRIERALRPAAESIVSALTQTTGKTFTANAVVQETANSADSHADVYGAQMDADTPAALSMAITVGGRNL